jgi:hypothetical protein
MSTPAMSRSCSGGSCTGRAGCPAACSAAADHGPGAPGAEGRRGRVARPSSRISSVAAGRQRDHAVGSVQEATLPMADDHVRHVFLRDLAAIFPELPGLVTEIELTAGRRASRSRSRVGSTGSPCLSSRSAAFASQATTRAHAAAWTPQPSLATTPRTGSCP